MSEVDARLDRLTEQVIDLEVKVAFQEKLLHDLDGVLRELFGEVEALGRAVSTVSEQLAQLQPETTDAPPPHY